MTRKQLDPLRSLTGDETSYLHKLARANAAPAAQVARAKSILAVAAGMSYTAAAAAAGRKSGDAVAHLVSRFNQQGLAALTPKPQPGPEAKYAPAQRELVLAAARRRPDPATDGAASWSLSLLQRHLQATYPELAKISTVTIWTILREAGYRWQRSRTWCPTGQAQRLRKSGVVTVIDPAAEAKKN